MEMGSNWVRGMVAAVIGAASGCQGNEGPGDAARAMGHEMVAADVRSGPVDNDQYIPLIRSVEALVKPYKSIAKARAAGYTTQLTDCMVMAGMGGMGLHYGNAVLIDATPDPLAPEALLYEPGEKGSLRFVGVEYIVPYPAWTGVTPPVLFGKVFRRNDAFQLWTLHLWVGRKNPAGLFADWNPTVHCP